MRIAVLHNVITDANTADERDVLVQAGSVHGALAGLGHESIPMSCDLNLDDLQYQLNQVRPDLVFNLVESLNGLGCMIHLVPFFLEARQIPYTGSPAEAIRLTSNKVLAKKRMRRVNLPTPAWVGPFPWNGRPRQHGPIDMTHKDWIVKSLWEHASVGIDDDALVRADNPETMTAIFEQRVAALGGACFAEHFIDGREFNLSLLSGPDGPEVLPPAEILFEGYVTGKPRIVGFRAKWDESSHEYQHTSRCFDFPPQDQELLCQLKRIALRCWQVFGLAGYARVDFRVDLAGNIWILEINANPCLSPDAGFFAAVERSGLGLQDAVRRIVADSCHSHLLPKPSEKPDSAVACLTQRPMPAAAPFPSGFRYDVTPDDVDAFHDTAVVAGFFSPAETDLVGELVAERLARGDQSGYFFIALEKEARLIGFSCYGPIPCTAHSYDLYWIVVHPDFQGQGAGRALLHETERLIRAAGGQRLYVDTSQRPLYAGTRLFYETNGYVTAAVLADFYDRKDGKVIYLKVLGHEPQ